MSEVFGYVRVSAADQNEARQIDALHEAGISDNHIYIDKQSGKDFDRPAYKAMMKKVRKGDIIYFKSLDRLGRNYDEIEKQWFRIQEKEVSVVIMDMPLLDTRQKVNGLTGRFIADLVLKTLSYVAQIERENIHQRQQEGIKSAKMRGVVFGRPETGVPENFEEICRQWDSGVYSAREAADLLGMPYTTFYRKAKKITGKS